MALPTNGRVIINTTVGELDIELWSKETPKTCRNFITLALEGYYDNVIFHRVVPGFLVQTGDRTGTGGGGESIYGEPFEDEIHPRLRFPHRGIVAMANNGTKNSNDSQFIITLDRADELHGKHTVFGRCVGDTVYNVLKIGEMEIGENERPVYPPKIKSIRIVDNPFDDIVPRITAAEKRAQQRAREEAQREREEEERRKGAKKNVGLLSFGEDEDAAPVTFKKKTVVRPDLVDDPQAVAVAVPDFVRTRTSPRSAKSTRRRRRHPSTRARQRSRKVEAEIRSLTRRRAGADSDDELEAMRKPKKNKSYLEEELARYAKGKGLHSKGKRRDESDVLAALNSFRGKLANVLVEEDMPAAEEDDEVDDDAGFMGHALRFPKDDGEESMKAERDYEVIDPRQRGARAKEEEERERKRAAKAKAGRGGRRY
ncbi:Cyclophilin-like protein [Mycena sanguinolenta]|uniref:Cyclophilin-like protein n=1 Tax=Mycena sanguinolenta TaxID=230812 RepID=A0A8H6Z553_9AGAR|nr:Cyclophilin-like protein [Mycena sanguinolenta]